MDNKNKMFLAIGAGLGIATGYLINSEKGKKIRSDISDELQKAKNNIEENGENLIEAANKTLADINATGKQYLASMKSKEAISDSDLDAYIETEINKMKSQLAKKLKSEYNGAILS